MVKLPPGISYMRFAVLMKGVLRGMGREERCELLATKSALSSEERGPVYSHCAIIEAPADMPDGQYEVEFGGEVAYTERVNGSWVVGQTLPRTHEELISFMNTGRHIPDGARTTFAAPSRRSDGRIGRVDNQALQES